MKYIYKEYPSYHEEISQQYNIEVINERGMMTQKKINFILFLSIFYPLCFVLGVIMFTYHSIAFKSFFYFLLFLIFLSLIVIPLHLFLQIIVFPSKNSKDCIVFGLNMEKLNFFACYKNKLSKIRLLFSLLLPFFILTIIPTVMIILNPPTMYLYAIICLNTLLSTNDIYECYILIVKGRTKNKDCFYIRSDNLIYRIKENPSTTIG